MKILVKSHANTSGIVLDGLSDSATSLQLLQKWLWQIQVLLKRDELLMLVVSFL